MDPKLVKAISKLPKQFSEMTAVNHFDEGFSLVLFSGEMMSAYILTPKHMKALAQSITHHIAEFEKKFGKIESNWTPPMPSPIQQEDLKKPDNK